MMRRIDNFLRNENENIYLPKGWRILNPLYNGLLEVRYFKKKTRIEKLNLKCAIGS